MGAVRSAYAGGLGIGGAFTSAAEPRSWRHADSDGLGVGGVFGGREQRLGALVSLLDAGDLRGDVLAADARDGIGILR